MKAALIKLHIAIFLWGFTGVLGRAIELNEGLLVWYRIFITVVSLFILVKWQNQLQKISIATIFKLFGIGTIIALHWVCFYGSIKYSNVSIALTAMSSSGVIAALVEPIMLKKKIVFVELLLGLLGIAGIYLIFHFDTRYQTGIIIGLVATILSVIFSILNKKMVTTILPKTVMLYELMGGLLLLTVCMPFYLHYFPTAKIFPSNTDWLWLIIMSWLCTIVAMNLALQALKKVSAFTQNLTVNLEPVYGIFLAFFVYHENEKLNSSFYIGFSLILLAIALQMLRVIKLKKH